jgi:hypothetical protein
VRDLVECLQVVCATLVFLLVPDQLDGTEFDSPRDAIDQAPQLFVAAEPAVWRVKLIGTLAETFKLLEFSAEDDRALMLHRRETQQQVCFAAAGCPTIEKLIGGAVVRFSLWSRQRGPECLRLPLNPLLQLRRFRLLEH